MVPSQPIPREGAEPNPERRQRRRFGLDTPLPADPWVIERAILRYLATERSSVIPVRLPTAGPITTMKPPSKSSGPDGLPELLLLLGGGRAAFFKIKTQAQRLTAADRAFADLCRERAIAVVVVRSLGEARTALDALLSNPREDA